MASGETWSIVKGSYLGDVTALCLVPLSHTNPKLLGLLAGSGPGVTLYELYTGRVCFSINVLDGVRVHGIYADTSHFRRRNTHFDVGPASPIATLVIHGERKVKLYELVCTGGKLSLHLTSNLPRFNEWVLDARTLHGSIAKESGEAHLLAVGLSNNSVSVWNLHDSVALYHIACSEKCLLYSMRLWGDSLGNIRVAAGTIFNEVLVWKPIVASMLEDKSKVYEHISEPMQKLSGHEGSIYRIAWSDDGLQLASVSDDRSARIWKVANNHVVDPWSITSEQTQNPIVLYGHGSRLWDCQIHERLLITASEDCTCRIWSSDGKHLGTLRGHCGRGIWRCIYDPEAELVVSAGADASIKVHSLASWGKQSEVIENGKFTHTNFFHITLHDVKSKSEEYLNSKSEYIRCLQFAGPWSLYVATNHGFLYHVSLLNLGKGEWTELLHGSNNSPVVCMDLLALRDVLPAATQEELIACGNGKGEVMVVRVQRSQTIVKVIRSYQWIAEKERQLLGVFCCKSLGSRYVFTANPEGKIHIWLLDQLPDGCRDCDFASKECKPNLLAILESSFRSRIVCLDASWEHELIVCGDQRGNIVAFNCPLTILEGQKDMASSRIVNAASFKGAHGISAVASIALSAATPTKQCQLISTGRDGCICKFLYDSTPVEKLVCVRVERIKTVTMIESIQEAERDTYSKSIATGFTSSDFIFWDLDNAIEVMRFPCGGWRRPHSHFLGRYPELQYCFAFLKDQVICVYHKWKNLEQLCIEERKRGLLLPNIRSIHKPFHGKEINSVYFVPVRDKCSSNHDISWIATGAEDGTVMISRYFDTSSDKLNVTMTLDEHVGGSAVRALALVETVYCFQEDLLACCSINSFGNSLNTSILHNEPSASPFAFLLFSVGAKEVATCWLLESCLQQNEAFRTLEKCDDIEINSLLTSKWLSTYIYRPAVANTKFAMKIDDSTAPIDSVKSEATEMASDCECQEAPIQRADDLRYLAVTGFATQYTKTRGVITFLVIASSDASLRMHAFDLESQLWLEVAVLECHGTPVLTLEHIVIPPHTSGVSFDTFLVFSGSTDGSIAVWDVTSSVHDVTKNYSGVDSIAFPQRPQTGRGSQGGKRWRTYRQHRMATGTRANLEAALLSQGRTASATSEVVLEQIITPKLGPTYLLERVHESGVNCISVATLSTQEGLSSPLYALVSGGDDQALQVEIFALQKVTTNDHLLSSGDKELHCVFKVVSQNSVQCAHASALKSIWTDGMWVFSTGLDQRLRCWQYNYDVHSITLTEKTSCVIDVPEAASLHVEHCSKRTSAFYRVAIVGRGLQVLDFTHALEGELVDWKLSK